jgi:hypothetical protein
MSKFDRLIGDAMDAFLGNEALRSNLSDDEAMVVNFFVQKRLTAAVAPARDETMARTLLVHLRPELETYARAINRLVDDRDSFTRKAVVEIMVALLDELV